MTTKFADNSALLFMLTVVLALFAIIFAVVVNISDNVRSWLREAIKRKPTNKKTTKMEIEEIKKAICEWQEKENGRVAFCILSGPIGENEEVIRHATTTTVLGQANIMTEVISLTMDVNENISSVLGMVYLKRLIGLKEK